MLDSSSLERHRLSRNNKFPVSEVNDAVVVQKEVSSEQAFLGDASGNQYREV